MWLLQALTYTCTIHIIATIVLVNKNTRQKGALPFLRCVYPNIWVKTIDIINPSSKNCYNKLLLLCVQADGARFYHQFSAFRTDRFEASSHTLNQM